MSFEPITINTQEELDAMFKDRIDRAKRTTREEMEKELANYQDYKDKAEQFSKLSAKFKTINTENEQFKAQISELNSQLKKYETDSVKNRLCSEFGLSPDLADRLHGDNEDELRVDAQNLQKIVGSNTYVAPLHSTEEVVKDEDESYKSILKTIKGDN